MFKYFINTLHSYILYISTIQMFKYFINTLHSYRLYISTIQMVKYFINTPIHIHYTFLLFNMSNIVYAYLPNILPA